MSAIFGEATPYVEGTGTPGCSGPCRECVLTAFAVDPINAGYDYATFVDCRLNCWPYSLSAIIDLPGNPGPTPQTATADIGLSKTDPALAGGLLHVTAAQLTAQVSVGHVGGDIAAGVPYCYINSINEQLQPLDTTAFAVPGTVGDPGPYTVLVEMVSYLLAGNHRVSYRFNGTEMVTTSDAFDAGPSGGFFSVYTRLGMNAPDPYTTDLGTISQIIADGCPTPVTADLVSTLDADDPQTDPAGAYVP